MAIATTECKLSTLPPELQEPIQERLLSGEEIYYCCKTEWRMVWVQVITSRQMVVVKANLLRFPFFFSAPRISMLRVSSMLLSEFVALKENVDSEYDDAFMVHVLGRAGAVLELCFASQESGSAFGRLLQDARLGKLDKSKKPAASTGVRLHELANLLQEGLINDEEYEQKRREILNEL